MSKENDIQILQVAKSKLTPENWFQNRTVFEDDTYDVNKHCCFYLALCQASREVGEDCNITASKPLCERVAAQLEPVPKSTYYGGDAIGHIIDWNDVEGRTLEQIHAKIDETIASLQAAT